MKEKKSQSNKKSKKKKKTQIAKSSIKSNKKIRQTKNTHKAPSKLMGSIFSIALSLALPLIFLMLPKNHTWLQSRPLAYAKAYSQQSDNMDIESRKKERHGMTYLIADFACKNVPKDSWFLMPTQGYYINEFYDYREPEKIREPFHFINQLKIFNFHCQDLKLLTMNMSDEEIAKAEYTIALSKNGSINVVPISSPQILEEMKKKFDYDTERATNSRAVLELLKQIQSR